jgi:membrane associated rhomboid family serine protease
MIKNNRFFFSMTMAIIAITSVVTMLQFVYPEILSMFRRDPTALAAGEWWRIFTPLLVHSDGWWQYIFNVACIAIIGMVVEPLYGRMKFLLIYLGGGLIGEIAGYSLWDPYGAGASVGLCGLLGALSVMMISGRRHIHPIIAMLSLYIIAGLVGFAMENIYVSILLVTAIAIFPTIIKKREGQTKLLYTVSGAGVLLGGMILLMLLDIHGAAILGGVCIALILLFSQGSHKFAE